MVRRQFPAGFEVHRVILAQVGIEQVREGRDLEGTGDGRTEVAISEFDRANTGRIRICFQREVVEAIIPRSICNIQVHRLDITRHIIRVPARQIDLEAAGESDVTLCQMHCSQIAVANIQ